MKTYLTVRNLNITYITGSEKVYAVRGIDFSINYGEILGIVGESGCGKTATALSVMGLLDKKQSIRSGSIQIDNEEIFNKNDKEMSKIRGNDITMVFQNPMTGLNPSMKIGRIMVEIILRHQEMTKKEAINLSIETLRDVGLKDAEKLLFYYPHELSGGMLQKIMIAMAIVNNPKLIIADEPTSALDVTVQSQILNLLRGVSENKGLSVLLISHDLGVVAENCHRMLVMYGGRIVEYGSVQDVFANPHHPYTIGLLNAHPQFVLEYGRVLQPVPGLPPNMTRHQQGCAFARRCTQAMNVCIKEQTPIYRVGEGHYSECWLHHEEAPSINHRE